MIILMVAFVKLWKYSTVLMLPFCLYFGLSYYDRDLRWQALTIFSTLVFMLAYLARELKGGRG